VISRFKSYRDPKEEMGWNTIDEDELHGTGNDELVKE